MADLHQIAEKLVNLTVLEAKELVKIMEDDHGIKSPEPLLQTYVPEKVQAVEEKQVIFNVVLTGAGPQKLSLIKEIKSLLTIGLVDAKKMVDNPPATIKEEISEDEANNIKNKLESLGGIIELK